MFKTHKLTHSHNPNFFWNVCHGEYKLSNTLIEYQTFILTFFHEPKVLENLL